MGISRPVRSGSLFSLTAGSVRITIADSERRMADLAVDAVLHELSKARSMGMRSTLWLMAAPSAFEFYESLLRRAEREVATIDLLEALSVYQFDDYPISRGSERFPVTFRHLIEERFITPLQERTGVWIDWHPLELTENRQENRSTMNSYESELHRLFEDTSVRVIEVKGIGMDGHWGFHTGEIPLYDAPRMLEVRMNSANITQQMIDWPDYYPRREDVPPYAVTCNVSMFLQADAIIDVVPQRSKEYAVLAAYGTGEVLGAIPSSALKQHPNAYSFLTKESARALQEYRKGASLDNKPHLPCETVDRLKAIWNPSKGQADQTQAVEDMMAVLLRLDMV